MVPHQIGLRADRLLASELRLSRSTIQRPATAAQMKTVPPGSDLRRPLRDGMGPIISAACLPEGCIDHAAGKTRQT